MGATSAMYPRTALIVCVRCLTSRSRVRSSSARACSSSVLIATNHMFGALYRLADHFRIGRIVLLPLDKGLNVSRRDQPDLVPQSRKRANLIHGRLLS